MNQRFTQVGATLVGAALIATAVAIVPAGATDSQHAARPDKTKTCSFSTTPCVGGTNNSSGPGVGGTNNSSGPGVSGVNVATGLGTYGGAANDDGILGVTLNPSNSQQARAGVDGQDLSSDGGTYNSGVSGSSTHGIGVFGQSTDGIGIEAYANYIGILAFSGSSAALYAASNLGNEIAAVQAIGGTSSDANGVSLAAFQNNGNPSFYVTNDGNAHLFGELYTFGKCSTGCSRTRGEGVVSYASQASAPMLEDVGEGRLVGGVAKVTIDAALARAIDRGAPYVVFVTPEGPSHGLYVTNKSAAGFEVAENDGGRSSIDFGYRIVAKPYGVRASRLPVMSATPLRALRAPQGRHVPR